MSEIVVDWLDVAPADLGGYRSNVIVSNGIPTRYYDVGSGTPLILLHGMGWRGESSGNTFVPVFPYLSQHYRVIAPDKLASGLTGNPEVLRGTPRRRRSSTCQRSSATWTSATRCWCSVSRGEATWRRAWHWRTRTSSSSWRSSTVRRWLQRSGTSRSADADCSKVRAWRART